MKKILSLILILVLALTLAACGGSGDASEGNGSSSEGGGDAGGEQTKMLFFAGTRGDMGFNDLGFEGATLIAEQEGFDLTPVEYGTDTSTAVTTLFDALDTGGYKWCVVSSWYILDSLMEALDGGAYADINFIVYDTNPSLELSYDNVTGIAYGQNEGSFITAVYSALMTETGKIGTVGNSDSPIINDFMSGYLHGVKWYNDTYGEDVIYQISYYGTIAIQNAYESANVYFDSGVDVFYNISGSTTLGAAQAAEERGGIAEGYYVIGVDMDQWTIYAAAEEEGTVVEGYNNVVTSMEKKIEDSILWAFNGLADGSLEWGNYVVGLADDGVGLSMNDNYYANTPEDVQAEMDKVIQMIIDGEIDVKSYFDFADYDEFAEYRDNPDAR